MRERELSRKFVGKYMRQAKQLGGDKNPCYSRQIGVVLVRVYPDGASKVLGTGYNGPPRDTPHCDERTYLEHIVWPQLTNGERRTALSTLGVDTSDPALHDGGLDKWSRTFLSKAADCKTCPRKLIGAGSGERLELCSCEHAEKNAIANATGDLHGSWAFCWCGVACWDCTKLMINAGIKRAFFVNDGSYARNGGSDYSFGSRWLFAQAGVEVEVNEPDFYLE